MPRSTASQNVTALTATVCRPCFLVSVAFANETVYCWTGLGNLSWGGQTWTGVGTLGTISPIAEGSDVNARGITLTLSGIPAQLFSDVTTNMASGKTAQVYFGFLDQNGALVADPIPAFIGMVDQARVQMGTDTATLSITVESRLVDMNRARGGRFTDQDQRQRYPSDGSLKYVHFLQDERIDWK
jgi:hypothetical protein